MNSPALIRLKDALALLDGPAPVAVQWVKYDERRGTGGDFGRLAGGRLAKPKALATAQLRRPLPGELPAGEEASPQVLVPTGSPKDPAHWANATRNLVDTATGKLVKVHIYLLTHVAGRKVYL